MQNILRLFVFFVLIPIFAQAAKLNIAVSDLAGQGIDQSSTAIISDRLRTELFKQGDFTVLERNAMQEVLKEQGFQQTGCTSDACAVQIGQLLGVSYIVVGTVGKLGHLFTVDVRMIDVSNGKIVYSENVDCDCPIEKVLTNSVVSIAQKIGQNIGSSSPSAQLSPSMKNNQATTGDSLSTKNTVISYTSTPKPKKSPVLKITCGALAVIAAGAGIVLDNMMTQKVKNNTSLRTEYQSVPGNSQYDTYLSKLSQNNKDAKTYETLRNASYILAGLGAIGFTVSFLF